MRRAPSDLCRSCRRGTVLVLTMACLLLAATMMSHLLHGLLQQRLQQRRAMWGRQAAWLSQGGLDRARAALARDADYAGETWRPVADSLTAGPAVVTIQVTRDAEATRIEIQADYPSDSPQRVRESRLLRLPPKPGDES